MFADMLKTPVADHFRLRRVKGDVGIELEIEGEGLPAAALTKFFTGKPDGSLRQGMEYVSKPLPRGVVAEKVNEVAAALRIIHANVRPTYRCSTHIHENYLDATFGDVIGTYICWALAEPAVFRAIPEGRDGSLFCVSSYDSGDLPGYFEGFCNRLADGFVQGFQPRGKYSSLNMTRLGPGEAPALGTLEYRIFPLSLDGEQVQQWAEWCGNIKSFVQKWAAEDPSFMEMVRWAEANPDNFLSAILGKHPFKHEAAALVDFGVRQAYELARITVAALKAPVKTTQKRKSSLLNLNMVDAVINERGFVDDIPAEVAPAQPVAGFQRRRRPLGQRRVAADVAGAGGGGVPAGGAAGGGGAAVEARAQPRPRVRW